MRFGLADVAGLRCAVQAVMRLGQIDPDPPHQIVRARRQRGLLLALAGIPEQLGVVVERRVAVDTEDLPFTDRQRVVLAAG
ncbi:hypothetical protein G6F66_015713 [Rhizopus arrhizus]|nr:hypothetical protein G6F66_015713 [Rhizopus arrhizus]